MGDMASAALHVAPVHRPCSRQRRVARPIFSSTHKLAHQLSLMLTVPCAPVRLGSLFSLLSGHCRFLRFVAFFSARSARANRSDRADRFTRRAFSQLLYTA